MLELSIEQEVLKEHFRNYFLSLAKYPEKYLPLFGINTQVVPLHMAYLCPLCLATGIFCNPDLEIIAHADFSLDHFPPKSAGGFLRLMVCKKCNNDAGSNYDFSLKQKMQNLAFNRRVPAATLASKSQITNVAGRYPSTFIINEDGQLEISLKPHEKLHAPFLDNFIEFSKTNHDYKIELTFSVADEDKVAKALLKTAYLFCFDLWGYEFVFSYTGEMIRQILNNAGKYPAKTPSFWLGEEIKIGAVPRIPMGVCYLKEPVNCKCFIVNIGMKDEETGFGEIASILIPGPSQKDWDDLPRIQQYFDSNSVSASMAHVTEEILSNNITDGYTKSWALLNNS